MQTVGDILSQIFTNFHPEIFLQFVTGYKTVCILMVLGYLLHFMPKVAVDAMQNLVSRSPLLLQALMLALSIWIVAQFKSAGVQPFIYFQF
jgi:alginate O-acetyltransferase complex protein AlgI